MNMPPEPSSGPKVFTNDPVRISWLIYGFIQAIITVLLATGAVSTEVGALITGIALALYGLVSELFVRPDTVPREPLRQLAVAEAAANMAAVPPPEPEPPAPPPPAGPRRPGR